MSLLIRELLRDMLSTNNSPQRDPLAMSFFSSYDSLMLDQGEKGREGGDIPSQLLELTTNTIGDLLVGAAHLDRVDLALAEALLGGIEACESSQTRQIKKNVGECKRV